MDFVCGELLRLSEENERLKEELAEQKNAYAELEGAYHEVCGEFREFAKNLYIELRQIKGVTV